jgi:hypothetical protein
MAETVVISLCTNDEHGIDTGRVAAIHIGNGALELAWGEIGSEPRYSMARTDKGYLLRFGRKHFPALGKTDWYGNWCWTAVPMLAEDAAIFLNHLSTEDRWHCEGGWCDLSDAYCDGKVTAAMVIEANKA